MINDLINQTCLSKPPKEPKRTGIVCSRWLNTSKSEKGGHPKSTRKEVPVTGFREDVQAEVMGLVIVNIVQM
jgi:hypothetical protein